MVFSNRTKTVTAFVFLWAARDISCEAPSIREEAEEDKVKSFGAWYTIKKTNKHIGASHQRFNGKSKTISKRHDSDQRLHIHIQHYFCHYVFCFRAPVTSFSNSF